MGTVYHSYVVEQPAYCTDAKPRGGLKYAISRECMTSQPLVLVYGATGTQGGPVAKRLLERGTPIRALARTVARATDLAAAGAEVVQADLGDQEAVIAATSGVDSVFVQLSASIPPAEMLQHARHALTAVREAGAPHLVITTGSIIPTSRTGVASPDAKYALLELINELTPHAVVLCPTLYLENFSVALRPVIEQGIIPFPIPVDVPVAYLSLDDHAAFAVAALDRPALAGQRFNLGGAEALTGTQLAERFSRVLGASITYQAISSTSFGQQLIPFLGEEVAQAIADMYAYEGGPGAAQLAPDLDATLAALPIQQTPIDRWIAQAFDKYD